MADPPHPPPAAPDPHAHAHAEVEASERLTGLLGWLHRQLHRMERELDAVKRGVAARLGWNVPRSLVAFTGWATPTVARCGCRVMANRPFGGPKEDDRWYHNLLNTYRRWNSREVPFVEVTATLAGRTIVATADEEGYARFDFDLDRPLDGGYWHEAVLEVPARGDRPAVTARCGVIRPDPDAARVAVVSDMDDTVLHTGITNLLTAARLTFLHNARTRSTLPGVSALYRALVTGDPTSTDDPVDPIFYVSSSAWNLHDLLSDFLDLNGLPLGPLRLRDLGIDRDKLIKSKGHRHKLDQIEAIADDYPGLPLVLFGDSGQADAELYAELAAERPGRVRAVIIRDVDPHTRSRRDASVKRHIQATRDAGVPAFLIRDSLEAARHLVDLGLLEPGHLGEIEAEMKRDAERPSLNRAATGLARR